MDFLDVTFDLYNSLYKPYRKPYNKPIYTNKQSNHPPNVLKKLPKSIAKRISDTSSSKDIFDKSVLIYQNALYESGFKEELTYTPSDKSFQEENGQRTKKRKIIWFNSPYSRSMETNIGKNFLHLLVKHFHFLDKKYIICLMIAFAWNPELHEYLSFILPFLNIYLCSLHWALWFNYRS